MTPIKIRKMNTVIKFMSYNRWNLWQIIIIWIYIYYYISRYPTKTSITLLCFSFSGPETYNPNFISSAFIFNLALSTLFIQFLIVFSDTVYALLAFNTDNPS